MTTTTGAAPTTDAVQRLSWWERQGDLITRRPFNEWTFTHMNRLMPATPVRRGTFRAPLPERPRPLDDRRLAELHERTFTTAFLVLHRGAIVHETYPGTFAGRHVRMQLFSISKSVLSLLVGIAVGDGVMRTDDPVSRFRPDFAGTAYAGTTVGELLDMVSGVGDLEDWTVPGSGIRRFEQAIVSGGDPAEVVRTAPRTAPAGTRFNYSTFDSQLLGWVLESATGQPLPTYASERLWCHLGADRDAYYWLTRHRPRTAIGAGSLNTTARDLARIGLLMAGDGRVAGEQIVPRAWVRRSTTPRIPAGTLGPSGYDHYGYANHWWTVDGGAFAAIGVHGQYLYVDPAARVVIVKCSAWPSADDERRDAATITAFREIAASLSA